MPLQTINGRDGTADIEIATVSYKCILDMFEIESNVPQIATPTFCEEGSTTFEPGEELIRFRMTGLLKKGAPASGPLIPAPQNVPLVFTFSTGCDFSFEGNFDRAVATRVVNAAGRITGEGVCNGAFVKTWDEGTAP